MSMRFIKLLLPVVALMLAGAGCFSLGEEGTKGNDGGVWKSTDAGLNWIQAVTLPTAQGVGSLSITNVLDFVFDPQDELAIYMGTRSNGMFFSYDGGVSWMQPREEGMRTGEVGSVAIDPAQKCTIYAVKSTQLAKSEDCGRTFDIGIYDETRPKVTITDLEIDSFNTNIVWISTSEGDIIKSSDGGQTWDTKYRATSGIVKLMIGNADTRIVYASTERDGLARTDDGGDNWIDLEKTMNDFSTAKRTVNLTQSGDGSIIVSSNRYGLLRSTTRGDTWEEVPLLTAAKEVDIPVVAFDPNNNAILYYATEATFYSTIDSGTNWQARRLPTGRTPSTLVVDPTDGNVLYLGSANFD